MSTMRRVFAIIALAAFYFVALPVLAQRWIAQLPQKPDQELTFKDYQKAFENYYKARPLDMKLDKLKPTFRFQGAQEEQNRVAIEEHKMFKRLEWYTEPRVYPSGRRDFAKLDSIRARLETDDELVMKQAAANPLNVKITRRAGA